MYCKHCGKKIDDADCLKEYNYCGKFIDVDSEFCHYCGKPQEIGLLIRDSYNNEIKAGSVMWNKRTFKNIRYIKFYQIGCCF